MTDLELQRWLAAQLPEEFDTTSYSDSGGSLVCWKGLRCRPVNHREWLYVVSLVEAKLTNRQHQLYRSLLFAAAYNSGSHDTNDEAERARVSATWQQRTRASMEVLK